MLDVGQPDTPIHSSWNIYGVRFAFDQDSRGSEVDAYHEVAAFGLFEGAAHGARLDVEIL